MIYKNPHWMTREGVDTALPFFVVHEAALPETGDMRHDIFIRGEIPWSTMILDLPGAHFGAEGNLPQKASSCRLLDLVTRTTEAVPVYEDEIPDRLMQVDEGQHAVQVSVRGQARSIGQVTLLVPHLGHRVVKVAWCSSIKMRMDREKLTRTQFETHGEGAWLYTPVFSEPASLTRYMLAFWEIPLR